MRPIDADGLIEYCDENAIPLNIAAVNKQPTIQVPATIQCKHCLWWETDYGRYGYCNRHGNRISTYKEGYCHLGERRRTDE